MKYILSFIAAIYLIRILMEVFIMKTLFSFSLLRLALTLMLSAAVLSLFTACGAKEITDSYKDTPTDVAIILGSGANRSASMVDTAMDNYKVRNILDIGARNGGSVTYIVNEQNPAVKTTSIEGVSAAYSSGQTKKIVSQRTQQLVDAAKSLKATTPQTNLIKCLRNARAYLDGGNGSQKIIIIADHALAQTSGIVDFSKFNVTQTEISLLVEYLDSEMLFSDSYLCLDGISVEWLGFCSTAAPQTEMTPAAVANMEQRWLYILNKAGALSVSISTSADNSTLADSNLPQVNCVFIPQTDAEFLYETAEKLDETKLLFQPDSTLFADTAKACQALEPYGTSLAQSDRNILIAGMCATADNTGAAMELSRKRAAAVTQLLCDEYGISPDRIEVTGLGCNDNPFRVMDLNNDGTLNETAAKNNRCIIIADASSQIAQQLKAVGGQ